MIEQESHQQELHLSFIDLKKAYGSVPLNKLWETLDRTTINTRLIEAIKSLYKGTSSKIRIGKLNYKKLQIYQGIKTRLQFIANFI